MQLPVLVLAYNRADLVEKQLRFLLDKMKCTQIYVSVDGAKKNKQDKDKVSDVKRVIKQLQQAHPRSIQTQFSSVNLGCQRGVEKGLDWFFAKVEAGIVLEDDCAAHPHFFKYCQVLLEKYKDDDRIGMVCGTNPLTNSHLTSSYFFSHQSIVWGWASWRRAWRDYRVVKNLAPQLLKDKHIRAATLKRTSLRHLQTIERVVKGEIDTWDYIWYFTNIVMSRLCIIPNRNLISNVGFAVDATHTKIKTTQAELPTFNLTFPLHHPPVVMPHAEFEAKYLAMIQPWQVVLSMLRAYAGV